MLYRRAKVPVSLLPAALTANSVYDRELDPALLCDIRVANKAITEVAPAGNLDPKPGEKTSDLGGRLVFPGFLDAHTHLDKAHSWNRAPNRRGQFWDAIQLLADDKKNWSPEDLHARAD